MNKVALKWVAGIVLILTLGGGAMVATIGITPLEKYITAMVLPCGLVWLLLLALGVAGLMRQQWLSGFLALAGWAFFAFVSSGVGSGMLVRSLESPFVGIRPLEQAPFDAVIVLGGGAQHGWNGRFQGNDRLVLTAQLYHQKVARKVICTGSSIRAFSETAVDPKEMSAEVLKGLGVPEEAIERVTGRNTSEEMVSLVDKFGDRDVRLGLVTSAWHLKRALRLAEKQGLEVTPLPSDFFAETVETLSLAGWSYELLPSHVSLGNSAKAIKEYLAAVVGR